MTGFAPHGPVYKTGAFLSRATSAGQQERSDSNMSIGFGGRVRSRRTFCMAEAQRSKLLRCLIFEIFYQVGFANELGPALHAIHSIGVDRFQAGRTGSLRSFMCALSRSTVSPSRIATVDASQYAVRPSRLSTLSTGTTWSIVSLFAARLLSTVLAGHLVTLEYVSATEGNCLRWHCIGTWSMQ